MYNIYLKEEDLLNAEQFPVAALINEAANSDIIDFVKCMIATGSVHAQSRDLDLISHVISACRVT